MTNLKTDYVDAVFTGNRKYTEVDNGDGTVSFTDSTSYTQAGTQFGASDINGTNGAINSIIGVKTATFSSTGWTGSSAPFTNTITVAGITSTDAPIISLNLGSSISATNAKSASKQWGYITAIVSGTSSLTAYAHTKPTVNLPIMIKGV